MTRYCVVLREKVDEVVTLTGKDNPRKDDMKFVALTEVQGSAFWSFPGTMNMGAEDEYFCTVILPVLEWTKEQATWSLAHARQPQPARTRTGGRSQRPVRPRRPAQTRTEGCPRHLGRPVVRLGPGQEAVPTT